MVPFANMGSGSSRSEVDARRKVVSTENTGKVEEVSWLMSGVNEVSMVGYLKARFATHSSCYVANMRTPSRTHVQTPQL